MVPKLAPWLVAGLVTVRLGAAPPEVPPQSPDQLKQMALDTEERMLRLLDPDLLRRADEKGLYKREDYPVLRAMNPFFLRGDFNGDGAMDVAVWVRQRSSGLSGVAIVHSTLDSVRYLGAGSGTTDLSGTGKRGEVAADAWHVLPAGTTVRAFAAVPEIGAVEGRPFTLRHEALQFVWLGKSSFTFYWMNGRYWEIWTGD